MQVFSWEIYLGYGIEMALTSGKGGTGKCKTQHKHGKALRWQRQGPKARTVRAMPREAPQGRANPKGPVGDVVVGLVHGGRIAFHWFI